MGIYDHDLQACILKVHSHTMAGNAEEHNTIRSCLEQKSAHWSDYTMERQI